MNINLKELGGSLSAQFRDLNGRHPGQWPIAPRLLCAAGVMAAVIVLGYFFYWSGQFEDQERLAQDEQRLRDEYKVKMAQAINLEALQVQRAQVDQYVERLQKQLPSKAEMAALLSDINQAGLGRGLQFELFKPAPSETVREFYAELPIQVKVVGNYHDMGAFASDVGQLSRIVTLNDVSIQAGKDGILTMDATARTFRYLDDEEVAAQRKAQAGRKGR